MVCSRRYHHVGPWLKTEYFHPQNSGESLSWTSFCSDLGSHTYKRSDIQQLVLLDTHPLGYETGSPEFQCVHAHRQKLPNPVVQKVSHLSLEPWGHSTPVNSGAIECIVSFVEWSSVWSSGILKVHWDMTWFN